MPKIMNFLPSFLCVCACEKIQFYFVSFGTVIPKSHAPPTTAGETEQDSIIPQWAIAVIVIGAGSLLFVVIFGAAVVSND